MKRKWILYLLAFGLAVSGGLGQSFYSFPEVFSTNPMNQWSLWYGPNIGNLFSMINGGIGQWISKSSRPSYGEYGQEFRLTGNTNDSGYWVFTCPQAGQYSMNLSITSWMQSLVNTGVRTTIEVYTSGSNIPRWSTSRQWNATGSVTTDLRSVSALQQMNLASGDQITIRVALENLNNFNECVFTVGPSGQGSTPSIVFGADGSMDVPWWSAAEGNPYVDASGNVWGVYQPGSGNLSNWSGYVAMSWDGSKWLGNDPLYDHPSFVSSGERVLTSNNMNAGIRAGCLTFTPSIDGIYGWAGTIQCQDWGGNGNACEVRFGKFGPPYVTDPNDPNDVPYRYTLLKSITVPHQGTVNLKQIPELQGIGVRSNEKLVVSTVASVAWSATVLKFRPNGDVDPARIEKVNLNVARNVRDYGAVGDGVADDTDAIQAAIGNGQGVIYFPSGTYKVTREIKVWGSYGYAKLQGDYSGVRPTILLDTNTPGYNDPNVPLAYVLRFYQHGPPKIENAKGDTYCSQLDGINFELRSGNPNAIAISHTGAQNSSIRNCSITMDGNRLGIDGFPGDSVCENITVTGGQVGVKKNEWMWPSTIKGCTFIGQSVAGADVYQNSAVFEGCVFDGCAAGIRVPIDTGYPAARLYLENCIFKNITGGNAIIGTTGTRFDWFMAMKNVFFQNVTNIACWTDGSSPAIAGQASGWCRADDVTHGSRWNEGAKVGGDGFNYRQVTTDVAAPTFTAADFVDPIPSRSACVSIKDFGAVGDGVTDDTQAIRNAIANSTQPIWFPMGTYRVTDTITLNSDTKLIGEHCAYSEIKLIPNPGDTSFNDSNNPKPLIDTVDDPNGTAVFAHFAFTGYKDNPQTAGTIEYNGLIGIRWRVGRNSIIDDIFSWNVAYGNDIQAGYAPLKITGSGGGHIRQFWAPWVNNRGSGSLIIDGTTEPMFLYGISFEHDIRTPMIYVRSAKNVTFRQIQAEQNLYVVDAYNSHNLVFNDAHYLLVENTLPVAMRFTDCSDVNIAIIYHAIHEGTVRYDKTIQWFQNGQESTVSDTGTAGYRRMYLFYDGFESGNLTEGGWSSSGCDLYTASRYSGTYSVRLNSTDTLLKSLSTANYQNIQFSYVRRSSNYTTENFSSYWSADGGGSWTTLESLNSSSGWTVKSNTLPANAANNPNIQIRFHCSSPIIGVVYVDEVKVDGEAIP